MIDVLIVGGGPAGQSAALVLARCRRSVALVDAGQRRNRFSRAMHNFLTRDGVSPTRFAAMGDSELRGHGVQMIRGTVESARRTKRGFTAVLHNGRKLRSRKLLLATGVQDNLPPIDGLREMYGISVHHCQYCDAFTWNDRRLAAYGRGRHAVNLAMSLLTWSDHVIALTDGPARLSARQRSYATSLGLSLRETRIARLWGIRGHLKRIEFADGKSIPCDALFFSAGQHQRSTLPNVLGCRIDPKGGVAVDRRGRTGVAGLFVAGDALCEVQFVINAAAEGAAAAVAINNELQVESGHVLPTH